MSVKEKKDSFSVFTDFMLSDDGLKFKNWRL